jgi:imidazole glycerol-phosphate synthase subunit HisH
MTLALINSGGYNIASVSYALQRLNCEFVLTDNSDVISNADKVIFPGVGTASNAMNLLKEKGLIDCIKNLSQPVLGICLGMQLLYDESEESDTNCLSVISDQVKKFIATKENPVPHMGWNNIAFKRNNPLLKEIPKLSYFYFVHSYYAPVNKYTVASCDYGESFTAIVNKNNFWGCQFHPEKSGTVGAKLLQNFLEL